MTFLVALTALIATWRQLNVASRVREEQAQPNVFIDMRRVKGSVIELFVKNIGSTIAYDIKLDSSPELSSTEEQFWIFEELPSLAPGQEWSTIWEGDAPARKKLELPDTYRVNVLYKDSQGKNYSIPNILDWRTQWQRSFVNTKDISDIANRLTDIRNDLRKTK